MRSRPGLRPAPAGAVGPGLVNTTRLYVGPNYDVAGSAQSRRITIIFGRGRAGRLWLLENLLPFLVEQGRKTQAGGSFPSPEFHAAA